MRNIKIINCRAYPEFSREDLLWKTSNCVAMRSCMRKFTCGWPSGMLKIFGLSLDCKRTLVTNEIYIPFYM